MIMDSFESSQNIIIYEIDFYMNTACFNIMAS